MGLNWPPTHHESKATGADIQNGREFLKDAAVFVRAVDKYWHGQRDSFPPSAFQRHEFRFRHDLPTWRIFLATLFFAHSSLRKPLVAVDFARFPGGVPVGERYRVC
jgi:hypothetical protein